MQQSSVLPFGFQYGHTRMARLRRDVPLLYRVHFDEAQTEYIPERGFVAGRSHQDDDEVPRCCFRNPFRLAPRGPTFDTSRPTHEEVVNYMQGVPIQSRLIWTTISLTVALRWADVQTRVWEGRRTNTRIAVIDAAQVINHAYTAVELLEGYESGGSRSKEYNFANALQVVFVLNTIPSSAILSTKHWKSIESQLPPWFRDPNYNAFFIQLDPPTTPFDAKIRPLFHKIRLYYGARCSGPLVKDMQELAIATAQFLLDLEDYHRNEHSESLLRELAWYLLTFPIASWSSQENRATPRAAYTFPTVAQRARFDDFVRRNCRVAVEEDGGLDDLVARLHGVAINDLGT